MQTRRFRIRRYSHKELASHYGCARQTLWRWIRRIDLGPRRTRIYSTAQVKAIVDHLGWP